MENKEWDELRSKFWDAFSKIDEEGKEIAKDLIAKEIITEKDFNDKQRNVKKKEKEMKQLLYHHQIILKKQKMDSGKRKSKSKNKKSKKNVKIKKLKGLNLI